MRVLQLIARGIASSMTFVLSKPKVASMPAPEPETPKMAVEYKDPDQEERRAVAQHIANLMIEDEWVEIGDQIAEWEANLTSTPGGFRFHEIAVDVALSGLQSLIDAAPHTSLDDLYEAEVELNCFIETHEQSPESHVLALLAARAHLVLGLAYRAEHWPEDVRRESWRRMAKHYVAAGEILTGYDEKALMSPLIAEARYMQGLGSPGQADRMPELFESWITLDPSNPAIYAAHAVWLADPDKASDETILAMADAAIERTADTLGIGGYALFFQPLLDERQNGRALYDPDLYASSMMDLATMSEATQAEVNRMADALAGEIAAVGQMAPVALRDTLLMLVQTELTVLYPKLWSISEDAIRGILQEASEALPGFDEDGLDRAA